MEDLGRFGCNNFELHDSQLFPFGWGTFPVTSLFNHSCDPNLIIMMDKDHQVLRAIRDVEIGEELCYSYIDVALSREERRKLLREKYFFECFCPKCGAEAQSEREAAIERLLGNSASSALKLEPGIDLEELASSAASTNKSVFVEKLLKSTTLPGVEAESREAKRVIEEAEAALKIHREGGSEAVPEREQVIALTKSLSSFSSFFLFFNETPYLEKSSLFLNSSWRSLVRPCLALFPETGFSELHLDEQADGPGRMGGGRGPLHSYSGDLPRGLSLESPTDWLAALDPWKDSVECPEE